MKFGLMSRIVLFLVLLVSKLFAQETKISGKVTDAASGDPVPFANVYFNGTTIGTTTNFEGNYSLVSHSPSDSLLTSNVGYKTKSKPVIKGAAQVINIQLDVDIINLQEVVIMAGENPAWDILRKVVKNKNRNDKRQLTAYEYDTYTKIEIDIDNISEKFRQRKVIKKITHVLDSIEVIAGDDGKPILPLFITESVSKVYYRDQPELKKERILKTKINGIGVEEGSSINQLVGSSFQEYNFYQNWLNILGKEFVSPIADGWRGYYEYDLTDSVFIDKDFCYRLDFVPRSAQDLAFSGTIWITKNGYALKQVDASIGKQANLNFIEKIRLQQELEKTNLGPWLPIKNRVLIDVSELGEKNAGVLAKFYTSNKNFITNKPFAPSFYATPIEIAEDATLFNDEHYWDTLRYEPLSSTEKNVYRMIDTLRNIPIVKTYTDIFRTIIDGYYDMGKVEVGPYLGLVAWNNIEGVRFQAGLRTNYKFSKNWIYGGQAAYGFKDRDVKYSVSVEHILSRKKWTTVSFRVRHDLTRLGVNEMVLADNPIFLTSTRWGNLRNSYYYDEYWAGMQRTLFKGFSQKISFRHWSFNPTFYFGFLSNPLDANSNLLNSFQASEVSIESHYGKDELFLQNRNSRLSLGGKKWPVIVFKYTHGFSGVFNSSFDYDRLQLTINKRIKTGPLGVGHLTFSSEYVFNTLPYPLLALHLGNQTPFYSAITYNLMSYGEFVSDHYAAVQYRQYLEGFLLNRIPLINKLKWRLLATSNIIFGGMRQSNKDLAAQISANSQLTPPIRSFQEFKPYIELGYGVENIFKFFRVDFVHRVSYLDSPGVRKFGVLVTAQFRL